MLTDYHSLFHDSDIFLLSTSATANAEFLAVLIEAVQNPAKYYSNTVTIENRDHDLVILEEEPILTKYYTNAISVAMREGKIATYVRTKDGVVIYIRRGTLETLTD